MKNPEKGFSLIEVLVAVAMVGMIAAISIATVSQIHASAKEEKLSNDARTLNRAVAAYLASGGSLADANTPGKVLNRLKSAATAELSKRMPGFSSRLVDPRISIVMQTSAEAKSGDPRVNWNSAGQHFVIATSGAAGVKEFLLDDSLAETPVQTEKRKSNFLYSKESTWVWDYQNRPNPDAGFGPTEIALVADPDVPSTPGPSPGTPTTPTTPTPPAGTLDPPAFSVPGGTYGIDQFALSIAFTDPNPPGTSKIIYAVDYGEWNVYTSALPVAAGTTISVQAVALADDWSDSGKLDHTFDASPVQLSAPGISLSAPGFVTGSVETVTATLGNPNQPGVSHIEYRINGGYWQPYAGPFTLSRTAFPGGAVIESFAAADADYWLDSNLSGGTIDSSGTGSGLLPLEITATPFFSGEAKLIAKFNWSKVRKNSKFVFEKGNGPEFPSIFNVQLDGDGQAIGANFTSDTRVVHLKVKHATGEVWTVYPNPGVRSGTFESPDGHAISNVEFWRNGDDYLQFTITNPNPPGTSTVKYFVTAVDKDGNQTNVLLSDYSGPFDISGHDVTVTAFAVSTGGAQGPDAVWTNGKP